MNNCFCKEGAFHTFTGAGRHAVWQYRTPKREWLMTENAIYLIHRRGSWRWEKARNGRWVLVQVPDERKAPVLPKHVKKTWKRVYK